MSPSNRLRSKGFSMVELLLVAVIVGVGLLGLMALMMIALRFGANAGTRNTATYLTEEVMADIKAAARLRRLVKASSTAPTYPAMGNYYFSLQDRQPSPIKYYDAERAKAGQPAWVDRDTTSPSRYRLSILREAEAAGSAQAWMQDKFIVTVSYDEGIAQGRTITKQVQLINMVSR